MDNSESKRRLRSLGITTPYDIVLGLLIHLSQSSPSGKRNSIYSFRKITDNAISRPTGIKIKRLFDAGKLTFMIPLISDFEGYRPSEIQPEMRLDIGNYPKWSVDRKKNHSDSFSVNRLELLESAESLAPESIWNIDGLDRSGLPEQRVLELLVEYDSLRMRRVAAEFETQAIHDRYGETGYFCERRGITNFKGIDRYLELHYIVDFQMRCPSAPFPMVLLASKYYAKGILGVNRRWSATGEGIIRYEVWRGLDYQRAYFKSMERYYSTRHSSERFREQMQPMLDALIGPTEWRQEQ